MRSTAAITVNRPRQDVERLWREQSPEYIKGAETAVRFAEAPGDRGTEVYVDLERDIPGGKLGEVVMKLVGSDPVAKVKDDLRRFKQTVETGEVARANGASV